MMTNMCGIVAGLLVGVSPRSGEAVGGNTMPAYLQRLALAVVKGALGHLPGVGSIAAEVIRSWELDERIREAVEEILVERLRSFHSSARAASAPVVCDPESSLTAASGSAAGGLSATDRARLVAQARAIGDEPSAEQRTSLTRQFAASIADAVLSDAHVAESLKGAVEMAKWMEVVAAGAGALGMPEREFLDLLTKAQISEDVWSDVSDEDFVSALKPHLGAKPPFVMKKAHRSMCQAFQDRPTLPSNISLETATLDQLIEGIDARAPEKSDCLTELLRRNVPGQGEGVTFADISFLVLSDKGELDKKSTRAVIELLRRGMPPSQDEILDPESRRTFVIYSRAELPGAQDFIDPLFPDEDLKLGVSMPFKVVVRPPLNDEQHQLLLFLRLKGKVKQPADKPACEGLVRDFSTLSQKETLDKYGGHGVYEKAARLPEGAPAGLPNVVRSGRRTGFSAGAARSFQNLPSTDKRVSEYVRWVITPLPVTGLRDILAAAGLPTAGNKDTLVDRVVDAFKKRELSLEFLLSSLTADTIRILCESDDIEIGKKSENIETILKRATRHKVDGALREEDEVEA